ncbi:unnamed protein product [Ceutorhynchus assimilis]|uniref:Translation initiation factor IF-2, mitochondrial n=1 Tax=Ceutorhynchus assimilis TaxID=467358 RepID=A0A9P0DDP1_9CUCU|nr:unnamed protein product [Ceutorhynchus assimilis]
MAVYFRGLRVQSFFNLGLRKLNFNKSIDYVLSNSNESAQYVAHRCKHRHLYTSTVCFKRRKTAEERKAPRRVIEYTKSKAEIIDVWKGMTLFELAKVLESDVSFVRQLFLNEIKNPNTAIDDIKYLQNGVRRAGKRIRLIAKPTNKVTEEEIKELKPRPPPKKEDLKPRPPVVTVMGHVDHGKTTLLDALRHSSVVDKEFGGITQHIGAFLVTLPSGAEVTFLDTPGHAAFSSMRARGANVTDIVVLVVAADDGVMEQTIESVRMARNAKVPILVAINKIDAPKADIERTENMLLENGIQVEKLGGDVQAVPVSALKKQNLQKLTEALVLQAELLEIGADPTGPVEAVIVESNLDPYRGILTTMVVQRGTLKKGDILVAGTCMAKVRSLKDADGKSLDKVSPGYPVEIDGWRDLPAAGDIVLEAESEKEARLVIKFREAEAEKKKQLEDLKIIEQKQEVHKRNYKEHLKHKRSLGRYRMKQEGPRKPEIDEDNGTPSLNVIVRADVDGTLEAILETLDTYESEDVRLDIVNYGVGPATQTDIELAKAFNCVIYAFNVPLPSNIRPLIVENGVTLKEHNVIYKLIEDFKNEINSRLPKKEVEEILGEAEVLQQFEINRGRKRVPVAGCRCTQGLLKREALFRVQRSGEIIYEGSLSSMRHLKSETDIIKADTECGLQLADEEITFEKGDKIICFEKNMVTQETDWDPGF